MLQNLGLRIEPNQLTHPGALPLTGCFGDQSDDFPFGQFRSCT